MWLEEKGNWNWEIGESECKMGLGGDLGRKKENRLYLIFFN